MAVKEVEKPSQIEAGVAIALMVVAGVTVANTEVRPLKQPVDIKIL